MGRSCLFLLLAVLPIGAQPNGAEIFESKIRPVLVAKCYSCHSSKLKAPMGNFVLDTKAGLQKGGASGPALIPRKPEESRLLKALRYADPRLQMPPSGKLPDEVIANFAQWISAGAFDPRADTGTSDPPAARVIDLEEGRKWWAFQPVSEAAPPKVTSTGWPQTKIDSFVLAKLESHGLKPSAPADPRVLIRRASLDLIGLAPTYEEIEAFVRDSSPQAYQKLIERLLASPHYGERWGRYWLDVARYAEDNQNNGPTNPYYPFAWRYRDWVIEAFNKDVAYDRFVKLQLAADQMPGVPRDDWRALGYLGIGPVTHKDGRLSRDVLLNFAADDWDERVDAVTRGLLGLTVSCARCHDHKFDPIRTQDYYSLAGVFASTSAVERPLFDIDPETENRFLWLKLRIHELNYVSNLLTKEPGTKPEESARKVARFNAELQALQVEVDSLGKRYPELVKEIARYAAIGRVGSAKPRPEDGPFMNAVYDAALFVNGLDPDLTMLEYHPQKPRDLPVFVRGNVDNPGPLAPRRFPGVLSKTPDTHFTKGSGRRELSEQIFTDAAPLAARVMVNRVWAWHFGKPLVGTPSDFGKQGERPSHPELLDDLTARFIARGWSLKWLHREILLSATYRQSSRSHVAGERADPSNRLLWRMNPRRMEIEAFRDSILRAAGTLDETIYGPSINLDLAGNTRRTIYATVSRQTLHTILGLYDLPDPSQHASGRDVTTTSLQQLFVLNSPFFQQQASALADGVSGEVDSKARIRNIYRRILARDPDSEELDLALTYQNQGSLAHYAQALLASNEFIFWP